MSFKHIVQMHIDKETKNTIRYAAEQLPGGTDPLVSILYIRKSAFSDGPPRIIQLVVTVPTEEDLK